MGGPGSSRWGVHYQRRVAVEDCWMIPAWKLKKSFSELPQAYFGSLWAVKITTGRLKRVQYSIDPRSSDSGEPLLKLAYNIDKTSVELAVELTHTQLHLGGRRSWFSCPLLRNEGRVCGKRVAKLWLPPGQRYFGCSVCHDLTHKSSLECHDFDRLLNLMSAGARDEETANMGKAAFKAVLSSQKVEGRKCRERTKSLLEAFDELAREG